MSTPNEVEYRTIRLKGKSMPDMPQEVHDAYEHAKRKQRPHSAPLPRWEELSVELREAFIRVYYQGRMNGLKEFRDLGSQNGS